MKKILIVGVLLTTLLFGGCTSQSQKEEPLTSENMKYICNVKQTKSVSLNNKKAGDFKSHLLHISLANVVVSFLLCKFFCGKFKYKIENSMKVTKKDILSIKAGSSKVMQLDSYKDCVNARSYAYQLAFTDPREDVERYSTSIDKDKNQITIEAIKK